MSGDWIKMRGNLWDDPRVSRLCDLTNQSEAAVIGGLYWLWATADQHTENGILPGLTLRAIDRKTGLQGFGDALVMIGWLADHPDGVQITRFEEHNGASAKKRCQTAKRVANFKAGNAEETQEERRGNAASVSSALPREEKRRDISEANASGAGAPADTADTIFALGVPLLTAAAVSERNARSMLGRLRKDHGDDAVIGALQRCASERPLQPVPWIQAALKVAQRPVAGEPEWRRLQRERNEAFLGPASASAAAKRKAEQLESGNVLPIGLG